MPLVILKEILFMTVSCLRVEVKVLPVQNPCLNQTLDDRHDSGLAQVVAHGLAGHSPTGKTLAATYWC